MARIFEIMTNRKKIKCELQTHKNHDSKIKYSKILGILWSISNINTFLNTETKNYTICME